MSRNKYPEVTVNRILDSATKLFLEKGYENTTIQDIVNDLGDLSKGAIYHHFSSKEDIIEAVSERMYYDFKIEDCFKGRGQELNGLEKLQEIILFSLGNTKQQEWIKAVPDLFNNPKLLLQELHESVKTTAPSLVPFIEEGIADGSITTKFPREAAEVLMLLSNIWINPLVFKETKEDFTEKVYFLKELLEKIGMPLMDERILNATLAYRNLLDE